MHREQTDMLMMRLLELSQAGLVGKVPGPKGGVVWLDALKHFTMPDILSVLTDWPKFNSRMPVPADIVAACRGRELRRFTSQVSKALEGVWDGGDSEVARRELAKIKNILKDCDGLPVAGTWHHVAGNSKMDHRA
jgi:hypothetical protein